LILAICYIFPKFLKYKLKRILNGAVCVFGCLSPLILFTVWAATHDIWNDYVSAPLYSKFGTDLPVWYVENVHSCPGEWRALEIALLLIVIFYLLLFARFLVSLANNQQNKTVDS
jgi:hypothetical protein